MTQGSTIPPPVTAVMDLAGAWLPVRLAEVEKRLAEIASAHGPELGAEAEATLAAGGKRLRPLLLLICAGEDGAEDAVPAATAIELVHMATLVHDDVLDGAPVRRGRPTVVARSGRDAAVSVGDLLFSRAFAELATAERGQAQVAELSSASVGLAQGELAQRRDSYDTGVTEERYLERSSLKTARLFEAACRIGRLAAGREGTDELGCFGREIGLAFQLLDDVLDVSGPPERTGKARGTDLLDGTVNLPLIAAMQRDPGARRPRPARPRRRRAPRRVCDRIAATGALDEVRERARAGIERAKRGLDADRVHRRRAAAARPDRRRRRRALLLGRHANGGPNARTRTAARGPPFCRESDSCGVRCCSRSPRGGCCRSPAPSAKRSASSSMLARVSERRSSTSSWAPRSSSSSKRSTSAWV